MRDERPVCGQLSSKSRHSLRATTQSTAQHYRPSATDGGVTVLDMVASSIDRPASSVPTLVAVPPVGGAIGPCLVWRFDDPRPVVSTAILGGGTGSASWILNVSVAGDYARLDPADHLGEIAAYLGLIGSGVAMMTAVPVDRREVVEVEGAIVTATVGVGTPTWAADPEASVGNESLTPGTINLVTAIPADLEPGAMVNMATTITEAKTQALIEAGIAGTGTATDAVCVVGDHDAAASSFGGPRSEWGARVAMATHRAVTLGLRTAGGTA